MCTKVNRNTCSILKIYIQKLNTTNIVPPDQWHYVEKLFASIIQLIKAT